MEILREPNAFVARFLSPQLKESGFNYVESNYLVKEGNALYNTLTDEAVLVEDLEKDRDELIKRWFYVPEGFDVSPIVHVIRQKQLLYYSGNRKKNNYVIFTTTACNAHCEYCFENGYKILTMTEDTASKVADYIKATYDPRVKEIKIKWFGGEPLVNPKAINIITSKLNKWGIKYWSELSTNGDLLDAFTNTELADNWHVKRIQFTIDETGERYDRIKGLGKGAFERLKTIAERLDKLPITLVIRVHYNPSRSVDICYKIVDEFKIYKHTRIYPRIVYGLETIEAYRNLLKIEDYIESVKKNSFGFPNFKAVTRCMADNPRVSCITPEGGLTVCEHYPYGENVYGSIDSNTIDDEAVVEKWSTRLKYVKHCSSCVLYPICRKNTLCPADGGCTEAGLFYSIESIKRALRKKVTNVGR